MSKYTRSYSLQQIKKACEQALQEYNVKLAANYDTGDLVLSPNGPGVVAAEMRSNFKFPAGEGSGDDNTEEIEAGEDNPAYVVGFVGESGVYRSSDLDELDVEDAEGLREREGEESDGDEAIASVSEVDFEETDMPEGWDEFSLISFYADMGGSVDEMANELEDEQGFSEEDAIQMAASMKDQVVGTERWRNRF